MDDKGNLKIGDFDNSAVMDFEKEKNLLIILKSNKI